MNRVVIIGRMVRDPELRTTSTGKSIASFSVAVDKRIKPSDGSPAADFFRCKVWGQGAEFLTSYGGKGRLVAVDGRLETSKFTTKDGTEREVVEIVADNVNLLDRAKDGQSETVSKPGAAGDGDYDPFAE